MSAKKSKYPPCEEPSGLTAQAASVKVPIVNRSIDALDGDWDFLISLCLSDKFVGSLEVSISGVAGCTC